MNKTKNIIYIIFIFSVSINCGKNKGNINDNIAKAQYTDSTHEAINRTDSSYKNYTLNYKLGETPVFVDVIEIPCNCSIKLFNMHENEQTSYEAGKRVLQKYGGRLIKIKQNGNRNVVFKISRDNYTIDPNRIFTEIGLEKTLNNLGKSSAEAMKTVTSFASELLDSLFNDSAQVIIALHNNTPGSYSIKSYMKGGEEQNNADQVYKSNNYSVDDFFVVTEKNIYDSLKSYDFNVVLQNNENPYDDGSLSVYCGKKKINYVNVEASTSHLKEQERMLDRLYRILFNINGTTK